MTYRQRMDQERLRRATAWAVVKASRRGRPAESNRERMEDLIARLVLDGGHEKATVERTQHVGQQEVEALRLVGGKPPRVGDDQSEGLPGPVKPPEEEQ